MEVKSTGTMSVNELFSKAQTNRVQQGPAQGSVDTSSRKAEAESYEKSREWTLEELTDKVEAFNQLMLTQNTSLRYEQHDKLDRMVISIVDKETDEIVKEIPPREFLDMISSMLEFAGIIIDEKI
ncbi:flagellar protein FlaG [Evansella sp. LMS18]|jgi:flagellar protein FlaG|uniref:flagellar protein FlaG n=1 Tax=Evansella sp. LMS18 TaxID=2924033 RepID=UPI0020D02CDE|nr:flagellar protein FlaG [Evansella sp. LMS18]UTR11754.1 flagellar protein FlaG [Evansella sp. LMS18]